MPPENDSPGNRSAGWTALAIAVIGAIGTWIGISGGTKQKELDIARDNLRVSQEQKKTAEDRRDRYVDILRDHDVSVKAASSRAHWNLVFSNKCKDALFVAVQYTAMDNEDVVQGWFSVEPGEKVNVVQTTSRDYMYYAEDHSGRTWGGSHSFKVDDKNSFTYLLNREFDSGWYTLNNEKVDGFKHGHIDLEDFGVDEVLGLTCAG